MTRDNQQINFKPKQIYFVKMTKWLKNIYEEI